jgi:hypothetical protein
MPQIESEPIIAYRAWEYLPDPVAPRIAAIVMKHRAAWAPMELSAAACLKNGDSDHEAPILNVCNCGFYAYKAADDLAQCLDYAVPGTTLIFGRVAIAGKIVETALGYRGQYAYPQIFYYGNVGRFADQKQARAVAEVYGCEIMPHHYCPVKSRTKATDSRRSVKARRAPPAVMPVK